MFRIAGLFLLFSGFAYADFDSANRAYDQGDFAAARAEYQRLIDADGPRANLYYNLGNAACRAGDKPAAFLAWERALALDAGHSEALANLKLLRAETGAKIPAEPWYEAALPSVNVAAWLAAGGFWGLCFCMLRRKALILAMACAVVLIWGAAGVAWHYGRCELWIVTAPSAPVRNAPIDTAPSALALPMGSRVRLFQERGPWIHAALPDGSTGWIAAEAAGAVN